MNKLENLLRKNGEQIKESRAKFVAADMKDQQEEIVRQLTRDLRGYERQLTELTDFYPDSALSLKVVKDNFDAAKWVKDVQDTKINIENTKILLDIAQETYNEYFEEDNDESLSK